MTKRKTAPVPAPTATETSEPTPPLQTTAGPKGKVGQLVQLLSTEKGATIERMMVATGWQAHSVRGALAGAINKKLGLNLTSEKRDGVRTYRIVCEAAK